MKLKNSIRKKLLTGFLIGITLSGSGVGKSFADSNSSDLKMVPKAQSDKLINEMGRARSAMRTYTYGPNVGKSLVYYNGGLYLVDNNERRVYTGTFVDPNGDTFYFDAMDWRAEQGWYNIKHSNGHDGRYYFDWNYKAVRGGLKHIDNNDFLFNDRGVMQTGIHTYRGYTYMMANDGRRLTGWNSDRNGNVRFLDPNKGGAMQFGFCYADPAGTTFFMRQSGVMAPCGIMEITDRDADKYHPPGLYNFRRHKNGTYTYVTTGYWSEDGFRYYFDENTGKGYSDQWLGAEKRSYNGDAMMYFDKAGHMVKGVTEIDGETYVFTKRKPRDANYYRAYGWYTDTATKKRYYFTDGVSARSATEFRSSTPKGAAVKGKQIINGKTYQFDSNGVLIK